MCDCEPTRREVLTLWAVAGFAAATLGRATPGASARATPRADGGSAAASVEVLPGLLVHPRDGWGADLRPLLAPERDELPKVLLVHHTATTNAYGTDVGLIRDVYRFHTGSAKGWRDVCYHFFIGRDGDVWEGRAGSLTGPVRADATGGNQGHAQLVCLLGDFTSELPTDAAQASLVKVLAWLGERYQIDTSDGATTTFVSQGSNLYPAGETVVSPTITGHRTMSDTHCPGDAFAPRLATLVPFVQARRAAWAGTMKPAVRLGAVPADG